MTLTEFLLARFDELESGWFAAPDDIGLPEFPIDTTVDAVAYVLADIAAKRKIVEYALPYLDVGLDMQADAVLRLLALPFAGHPDYDESWGV